MTPETNSGAEAGVHIASVATAAPPFSIEQSEASAIMAQRFGHLLSARSLAIMKKVFSHPSIRRRHLAITDPISLLEEDPDPRVARFTHWAVELSAQAVARALDRAGMPANAVSALVVNTCTGYICPGISTYVIERLGLPKMVRAYDLVGSGCGGAIPNLQVASDSLKNGGVAVSVSVEICSATFQMGDDLSLIVSNALFGDGAAAAVLMRQERGLSLVDSVSLYDPAHRDDIRYVHKNGQLHNQLKPTVPALAAAAAASVTATLLERNGLQMRDVRHWIVHPGGDNVINAVRDELHLADSHLALSRQILSEHGNLSSPTIMFVLREVLDRGVAPGDWLLMVAFGAGLSAHACLLRACDTSTL